MTLIDITQKLSDVKENAKFKKGRTALAALPPKTKKDIMEFIFHWVEQECLVGWLPDDEESEDIKAQYGRLSIFNVIEAARKKASEIEPCYFCNDNVDPNAHEFNENTELCIFCQLKLANILQYMNINPQRLIQFALVPRKIQKARIKNKAIGQ